MLQSYGDWIKARKRRNDIAERREKQAQSRLPVFNRQATDERTIAERKWSDPLKPPAPQKACDLGLFSDDANQLDLIEMFQEPTNGE